MRKLWFVIQMTNIKGQFRAIVVSRSEWDNIANLYEDYSTKTEWVATANCLPRNKCYQLMEEWNEGYRKEGKLLQF